MRRCQRCWPCGITSPHLIFSGTLTTEPPLRKRGKEREHTMDIEGWNFKRTSDGRIVIRQDDGSGVVVADGDNESIAAAILYRLASDLLDRVAQPPAK